MWNEDGIQRLREGVLFQACKDYVAMMRWKTYDPILEEFFRGGGTWAVWCGDLDPRFVKQRLVSFRRTCRRADG